MRQSCMLCACYYSTITVQIGLHNTGVIICCTWVVSTVYFCTVAQLHLTITHMVLHAVLHEGKNSNSIAIDFCNKRVSDSENMNVKYF